MAKHVINPDAIRRRISSDLLSLVQILRNETSGVVLNPEVLASAANQANKVAKNTNWTYEVANLQFRVATPQNVLPTACGNELNIYMDLKLRGECNDELDDCLTALTLEIRIETESKENICSWHFDRHITDDESAPTEEAHPQYHFQHGGHAMKHLADSLGKTLLLPAPRLAFPPMDAVLAIDFILSNFAGLCWQELRNEATYTRLLKEAQLRYWKPYVMRLASWWEQGPKDEETIQVLWPHLV
jgi:hypothetical protein